MACKMGPIGCRKSSVVKYQYSLRNDPEERTSQSFEAHHYLCSKLWVYKAAYSASSNFEICDMMPSSFGKYFAEILGPVNQTTRRHTKNRVTLNSGGNL